MAAVGATAPCAARAAVMLLGLHLAFGPILLAGWDGHLGRDPPWLVRSFSSATAQGA